MFQKNLSIKDKVSMREIIIGKIYRCVGRLKVSQVQFFKWQFSLIPLIFRNELGSWLAYSLCFLYHSQELTSFSSTNSWASL
jgi:hypothetical protein